MLNNRRGLALITTLWILAALVILAIGIGFMARTEAQITSNFSGLLQCRWAARAGINRALIEIEKLKDQPTTYLGEDGLMLSSAQDDIDLGDSSFEVVIEDEAGKININSASRSVLENLFSDRDIAESIMDWRDTNDEPRPLGAETQYYSTLKEPYRCKNKPFDTVQELQLVKGISDETLSTSTGTSGKTLADLLTVYSHDGNKTVDGQDRINIQSASKDDLKSKLGDTLSDQDIDAIIEYRGRRPFSHASEVIRVPGLGRDKVSGIYDRITAKSDSGNSSSGSSGSETPGQININTAPVEVLAALPGMDEGMARAVVEYRQDTHFEDVGKLLDVAGITDDAFAQAADFMTVRSRVFRITATGRLEKTQVSYKIICIVDSSGDQIQTKYWRE